MSSPGLSVVYSTFRKKETLEQNDDPRCKPCWVSGLLSASLQGTEMQCPAQQPVGQTLPVICSGTCCDTSLLSQFCLVLLEFLPVRRHQGFGSCFSVVIWFATLSVARSTGTTPGQLEAAQDCAAAVRPSSDTAMWWANQDSRSS